MASLSALPVLAARALPASRRASASRAVAPARRVASPAPLISERARGVTAAAARVACRASSEDDDDYELSADDLEFMDGEFVVEAFDDDAQLAKALVMEVQENAKACIDERGAFVMAVPGGSVAKALAGLKDVTDVDWSKVHLFFVNERTPEGKCFARHRRLGRRSRHPRRVCIDAARAPPPTKPPRTRLRCATSPPTSSPSTR